MGEVKYLYLFLMNHDRLTLLRISLSWCPAADVFIKRKYATEHRHTYTQTLADTLKLQPYNLKFSSCPYTSRGSAPYCGMSLTKWWILCAVLLSCLSRPGSCRRNRDDKNPCHLPEAPGPCRGLVTRYFFDSNSQQCKHFFYGGCFGNANNFRSMADCQAKCQNPVKPTMAPEVHTQPANEASVVQSTVVTGELSVSEPQVQVNGSSQERNDFSRSDMCLSPVERGTCHGAERRFAYNPETRRCQMFFYSGCGGNNNNFPYRKHCVHKCIKSKKGHIKGMIRIRKKNVDSIVNRSV
ncbi:tissue factor pathway inhibitor a isoform X2 [Leuresthes tenuis]|uniref:tissue factor pathway inhibitor a isoform X2 n=1 Tax=Leuresthes tenuis TaxID=355514 RepID=UPI003B512BDA